ncbi:ATP-binding protein [Streptomyces lydicus]|uniref:ATP-binding protein n=1 Tax=Streptomyces lydicus TaxID=47763 RepID=UPI0036E99CF5
MPSPAIRAEYVLSLAHDTTAPATARHSARRVLDGWKLDKDALHDALLVISELVTNAVEHALPPVALHLSPTQADSCRSVHINVTDGGPAAVSGGWVASCSAEEHGRGEGIVAALAAHNGSAAAAASGDRWALVETAA